MSRFCLILAASLSLIVGKALADSRSDAFAAEVRKAILYAPRPAYPIRPYDIHFRASGVFLMRVRVSTGLVDAVTVVKSTGRRNVDETALDTLWKWRFKPGALPPLKVVDPKSKEPWAADDSLLSIPLTLLP